MSFYDSLGSDIRRFHALRNGLDGAPISMIRTIALAFHPRLLPVTLMRVSQKLYDKQFPSLARFFSSLNLLIFGIEISPKVKIKKGIFLPHTVGTVIGAQEIGENCTIHQGVTIGSSGIDLMFDPLCRPIIGNDVFIGSGAKILGQVVVGHRARVGANAVVVKDVPDDCTVIGVPASELTGN